MTTPTLKLLAERIKTHRKALWDWHCAYAQKSPAPFYCSIDLRDSGHKIVPVDSNLYPAGFNNICPEDRRVAPPILRAQIEAMAIRMSIPTPKKILIIPESHTKNTYYIENLFYLNQIIENAGFETCIGWYGPIPTEASSSNSPSPSVTLVSFTGKELIATPIKIQDGNLSAGEFVPDLILLNNDFSGGYPKDLDAVKQPIAPSHTLGWHSRKKSEHFVYYNRLAAEFAAILDIDPWFIQIDTQEVAPVNFNEDVGVEEAASAVDAMLDRIRAAYLNHQVKREPFVFVKNNAGTYGMGITVVHSGDDIRKLNRREKNKMSVGKNRAQIGSVVVQEGVPTATVVDRLAAEPVIYLMGGQLIGGFLRTNTEKGDEDNLNSQGMVFKKLCMADLRSLEIAELENADSPQNDDSNTKPKQDAEVQDEPTLELVYGAIARISALAAGLELAAHKQ